MAEILPMFHKNLAMLEYFTAGRGNIAVMPLRRALLIRVLPNLFQIGATEKVLFAKSIKRSLSQAQISLCVHFAAE